MITFTNANEEKERQISARKDSKKLNIREKSEKIFQIMTELNEIIEESRICAESYKEALNVKLIQLKQNAQKENLIIDRDIPSDGNCMFHALSLQLSRIGIGISNKKRNNPILETSDGQVDFFAILQKIWTGQVI